MIVLSLCQCLMFWNFFKTAKPRVTIVDGELTVLQYGELFLSCTANSFTPMTVKLIKAGVVLKEIEGR
jgi:hypothetical protein